MEETSRQVLETELAEALRRRQELDVVIAYLGQRLGKETSKEVSHGTDAMVTAPEVSGIPPPGDPSTSVGVGEFIGMSGPKATVVLLRRMGRRPLRTPDIFRALQKGGINNIKDSPTLYRSLTRDKNLKRVDRGLWGLAAWYPQGIVATKKDKLGEGSAEEESPSPESVEPPNEVVA